MSVDQRGLAVNAAGFVTGDRPTIFISLIDTKQVFRLKLSVSGASLAGEYDSLSVAGPREFGTVTGHITLAAGKRQVTLLGKSVNPSATSGAWVGRATQSMPSQNEDGSNGHFTEKKSIYKSSSGQGVSSAEDSQITSSYA